LAISYELFTAEVTFLSKYLSKANDNRNNENNEINIEGIKVNKAKNVIYFLFALEPDISISIFQEFLTSIKIIKKRNNNKPTLDIKSICRFTSLNSIKLLSIKVKKVKKPIKRVIINRNPINIFFLINSSIMR
tara:strand:- start:74 stop:472 length:399 start_codon:yes stop_codon:yes gene_type:complete